MNSKTIPYLVCLVLLAIILLQRCGNGPSPDKPRIDTVIVHDTLRIHDTTQGKPIYIKSIPEIHWVDSGKYKPSPTCDTLLKQYIELGDLYFSRNIYKTPFKLGIYGDAVVTDTIVSNKIVGNSIIYNLKIPTTTTTITIHEPYIPKRQLYLGLGMTVNKTDFIKAVDLGFIYKNKKDQIFQVRIEQPFIAAPISYSVGSYWKLKF